MSDFNSLLHWSQAMSQPHAMEHLPSPPTGPSLTQMVHDYNQRHSGTVSPAVPAAQPGFTPPPMDTPPQDPGIGAMPPTSDPGPQLQVSPDMASLGDNLTSLNGPAAAMGAGGHGKGGPGSVTGVLSNLGAL